MAVAPIICIFGIVAVVKKVTKAMGYESEHTLEPWNKNEQSLTPDILRTYEGLAEVSDTEAWEIIEAVQIMARILFEIHQSGKMHDMNKKYVRKRKHGK